VNRLKLNARASQTKKPTEAERTNFARPPKKRDALDGGVALVVTLKHSPQT